MAASVGASGGVEDSMWRDAPQGMSSLQRDPEMYVEVMHDIFTAVVKELRSEGDSPKSGVVSMEQMRMVGRFGEDGPEMVPVYPPGEVYVDIEVGREKDVEWLKSAKELLVWAHNLGNEEGEGKGEEEGEVALKLCASYTTLEDALAVADDEPEKAKEAGIDLTHRAVMEDRLREKGWELFHYQVARPMVLEPLATTVLVGNWTTRAVFEKEYVELRIPGDCLDAEGGLRPTMLGTALALDRPTAAAFRVLYASICGGFCFTKVFPPRTAYAVVHEHMMNPALSLRDSGASNIVKLLTAMTNTDFVVVDLAWTDWALRVLTVLARLLHEDMLFCVVAAVHTQTFAPFWRSVLTFLRLGGMQCLRAGLQHRSHYAYLLWVLRELAGDLSSVEAGGGRGEVEEEKVEPNIALIRDSMFHALIGVEDEEEEGRLRSTGSQLDMHHRNAQWVPGCKLSFVSEGGKQKGRTGQTADKTVVGTLYCVPDVSIGGGGRL